MNWCFAWPKLATFPSWLRTQADMHSRWKIQSRSTPILWLRPRKCSKPRPSPDALHWQAMTNDRRRFLQAAGTGITAFAGLPQKSFAENVPNTNSDVVFPVTRFGAEGDGKTLDTDAINSAIDSASRAG